MTTTDAEEIQTLQKSCRTVTTDAAQLSQTLRRTCRLLGGPCQQQADNVLGVCIAVNASRSLRTIWPILFQQLRDCCNTSVKLKILGHFACVADRIAPEQRSNAFRVFANEVEPLLSEVDVLIDNSFLKSFTDVLEALGVYAESDWCQRLFNILTGNILSWTRTEALRAAANAIVAMVGLTNPSGSDSLERFLENAETEFPPLPFVLILDSSAAFFAARCNVAAAHGNFHVPLSCLRVLVSKALGRVFCEEESATSDAVLPSPNTSLLPPVVSVYCKLREMDPSSNWTAVTERSICQKALALLGQSTTKKILISPLLRFLQATSIQWWKRRKPVWRLAREGDSLLRGEAFAALANSIARRVVWPLDEAVSIAQSLLDQYLRFAADDCVASVTGILKCIMALFPRLESTTHRNEIIRNLFAEQNENSSSKIARNSGIQTLVWILVSESPVRAQRQAIPFVVNGLRNEAASVRRACLDFVVDGWCEQFVVEEFALLWKNLRSVDFFEGALRRNHRDRHSVISGTLSATQVARNYDTFLSFLVGEFMPYSVCTNTWITDKEIADSIVMGCENIGYFLSRTSSELVAAGGASGLFTAETIDGLVAHLGDLFISGSFLSIHEFEHMSRFFTSLLKLSPKRLGGKLTVFEHKDLVNFLHAVLLLCCECVDGSEGSDSGVDVEYEECLYFSRTTLPEHVVKMVRSAAEASLTNKQNMGASEFYKFVDTSLALFVALVDVGEASPVFLGHLRNMSSSVLGHLSALVGSNPCAVLHFVETVDDVLFQNTLCMARPSQFDEQYRKFLTDVNSVLIRVLDFDLSKIGADLFRLANAVVSRDAFLASPVSPSFYTTLDPRGSLLEKAVLLATWEPGYRNGPSAYNEALKFILALMSSPRTERTARKHCTAHHIRTAQAAADGATRIFGPELMARTRELLAELRTYVDEASSRNGPEYFAVVRDSQSAKGKSVLLQKLTEYLETEVSGTENSIDPVSFFEMFELFSGVFSGMSSPDIDRALAPTRKARSSLAEVIVVIYTAAVDAERVPDAVEKILEATKRGATTVPEFVVDFLCARIACIHEGIFLRRITIPTGEWTNSTVERLLKTYRWGFTRGAGLLESQPVGESGWGHGACIEEGHHVHGDGDVMYDSRDLAKSHSLCSHSGNGADEVSTALRQMSTGVCALASSPIHLVTEGSLDRFTLTGICECSRIAEACQMLQIVLDENNARLLDANCIIALAKCALDHGRSGESQDMGVSAEEEREALPAMDEMSLCELQRRCVSLLQSEEERKSPEHHAALRYSVSILVLFFQLSSMDGDDEKQSCQRHGLHREVRQLSLDALWVCCDFPFVSPGAISVGDLASNVRKRILQNMEKNDTPIFESAILWLTAKFCGDHMLSGLSTACATDGLEEWLRFLCAFCHITGMAGAVWEQEGLQAHCNRFLTGYASSPDLDISPDDQRVMLWLLTGVIAQTLWAGDLPDQLMLHTSLSDNFERYNTDFPLSSLETKAAGRTRRIAMRESCPFYKRQILRAGTTCNHHLLDLLLPLGAQHAKEAQSTVSGVVKESALMGLQMLSQLLDQLLVGAASLPPFAVADIFSSSALIATRCTNYVRLAVLPATGPLAHKLARVAEWWLMRYGVEAVATDAQTEPPAQASNVLRQHVGLFPGSSISLDFHDVAGLLYCSLLLACCSSSPVASSLGVPASFSAPATAHPSSVVGVLSVEQGDGCQASIVSVIEQMLSTDLFLYTVGFLPAMVLSSASRRHETNTLAASLSRRVGEDINMGRWGQLAIPFSLLQLLRAACATLSMTPEEKVTTKLCEGVWDGVLQRFCVHGLTRYAHYTTQCLMQITPMGGEARHRRQWEMLRMLVMSTRADADANRNNARTLLALCMWSAGYRPCSQAQKNQMPAHRNVPRRVSLSWSEDIRAAGGLRDEHGATVRRLKERFLDVHELLTRAALILRSAAVAPTHSPAASGRGVLLTEDERERSKVQVTDMLAALSDARQRHAAKGGGAAVENRAPTATELLCLEVLAEATIPPKDAFYSALNHFDFSMASRRALFHPLTRILDAHKGSLPCDDTEGASLVCRDVLALLTFFYEAASQRALTEEHSWWIVVVLLDALLSAMSQDVCRALLSAVVVENPAAQLRDLATGLAWFYRESPLLGTAVTLLQSLPKEAEGVAETPKNTVPPRDDRVTPTAAVSVILDILTMRS